MKLLRATLLPLLFLSALSIHAQNTPAEDRLADLLERFPAADTNKDGTLTIEEALAYREAVHGKERKKKKSTTAPTHADVAYGDHERQKFDVWIPDSPNEDDQPFPLLVYYHGGGFVGGDKSSFDPRAFLANGIACASVNYRLVDGEKIFSPTPLEDAARALQTIRHRAEEWNLDGGRVALSGGSAGGVITLWIGYRDDMADPDSEDPIARESTRTTCLIPINAPTNLMPDWIIENIGGPRTVHSSFVKLFGETIVFPMPDSLRSKVAVMSPWEYVSSDDPPTLLIYSAPLGELPLPESASSGQAIHHPGFGKALEEKLTETGVEVEYRPGFDPRGSTEVTDYLRMHFGMLE